MKPLRRITSLAMLCLYLMGCNNSERNKYTNPIKAFNVGQITYKVYGKSYGTGVSKDGSQLDTSKGYFLKMDLGITNNSNESIKFDTSMFRLSNADGKRFAFSTSMNEMMAGIDSSLNGMLVQPNETKNGFIVFDVPSISDYNLELNNGNWGKTKYAFLVKPTE
jgi:hypothetical protein